MQHLWRYYKIDDAKFADLTNHQIQEILLRPEPKKK
jgi:hypothetical protein